MPSTREMTLEDLKKENEALYEKEKELQNEICKSKPIQLTIADTRICNLNCIMCQKNAKRYSNPLFYKLKRLKFLGKAVNELNNFRLTYYKDATMDFSLFEKIANEMFPYLNYVYPTVSGEPFINKNFYKELDLVEKFKVKLIFFTNATFVPKGKELNRIMNSLYRLIVSFDAAGKNTYEKIRRFARFEKVIDNIRRFNNSRKKIEKNKRPLLTLKLVLMKSNIEELSDWVKLAKDLEVDSIVVSHVVIFDKELEQESLIYHKGLANYHIEKARNLADELNLSVEEFPPLYSESSNTEQEFELDKNDPCAFLWREAFIELDGSVYPCCGSIKSGLLMGNVKKQTFDEIWNGPRYRALRRGFKTGEVLPHCKSCYLRIRHTNPDRKEIFIL